MQRTTAALTAALTAGATLALSMAPVGAGTKPTITVDPNPVVTGETVTVASAVPCYDAANIQQVEVLVDDLGNGDQLYYPSFSNASGAWELQFPAGNPGSYEIIATCVYLQNNLSTDPMPLQVVAEPTTTTTTTAPTTTTVAPTTTTAPTPAAVVVTPAYTG